MTGSKGTEFVTDLAWCVARDALNLSEKASLRKFALKYRQELKEVLLSDTEAIVYDQIGMHGATTANKIARRLSLSRHLASHKLKCVYDKGYLDRWVVNNPKGGRYYVYAKVGFKNK